MLVQRLGLHLRSVSGGLPLIPYFVLAISAALAPDAKADSIGPYNLGNFILTNTNANGFATTPDGGVTFTLTGPNNGTGFPGTTDLTIIAAGTGLLQFQYVYSSLDRPGMDYAGYLLGSAFVQIASTNGQSGMVALPIGVGETFGFRVGSLDNIGEAGMLTISNFTAPSVPEPSTFILVLLASGVALVSQKARRRGGA